MFVFPNRLYPITDTELSGLRHAEQVEQLAAGGAKLIQIREKNLRPRAFFEEALDAVKAARQAGCKVIINDRVDIALAVGADGVHLGQDDMPPDAARRILGPNAIIGFSTHTLEQAKQAVKLPINYLAVGPIFGTQTKVNPDAEVGLEGLSLIREVVTDIPLVAIGGMTLANSQSVIAAGADAVAVISALYRENSQIPQTTNDFLRVLEAQSTK
ncbi:MAG TPA: thiamine phosphate synthase [Pyrinomonadaceae bacterium]|nr:thiamine phosphate synthase [Pyrinomonadaceae bacterium]